MHALRTAALIASLLSGPSCSAVEPTDAQSARLDERDAAYWRAAGRARVAERASDARARNVILFVGDGMGVSTVTAARILAGQLAGGSGEEHLLSFESFPQLALSKTYNTNQQTPDSAGTMTAMITGVKTLAGVLSVNGSVRRGDCASSLEASVPSLIELAEDAGLATGVVSTARVTHATPGATFAHTPERDWEVDTGMPASARAAGCEDVAAQFLSFDHGDGVDLLMGGGRAMFMPEAQDDPEYPFLAGRRADGRDLIAEWQAANPTGHYVWKTEQFESIPSDDGKVLALFEPSHMKWEADRAGDTGGEPSIAAMTAFAIERLSASPAGYVLMVEAGRIDHGHHAANAYRALTDTIALSDAVAVADRMTSREDTLILVTADHSHTMTIAGYPTRGNPILGLVVSNDRTGAPDTGPMTDVNGRPYTTLGYANGAGYQGRTDTQAEGPKRFGHRFERADGLPKGRSDLSDVDTTSPSYLQEAPIPMGSETHGGEDVAIYARGPGSERLGGVVEQSVIYYVLEAALEDRLDVPPAE